MTTGRILSQYNVGAQTRRTANVAWHSEDRAGDPSDTTPRNRGICEGDWAGITSRAGETVLRATITERVQPGVVYTTFHFPESGANVDHHRKLRLGHQLPRIQGHGGATGAREPAIRMAEGLPGFSDKQVSLAEEQRIPMSAD